MKLILENSENDISLQEVKDETKEGFKCYFLSKENKEENIIKFQKSLEKSGKSVYFKKIKYSIDEHHYLYSLRVIEASA